MATESTDFVAIQQITGNPPHLIFPFAALPENRHCNYLQTPDKILTRRMRPPGRDFLL
jgi:hypothetical protein